MGAGFLRKLVAILLGLSLAFTLGYTFCNPVLRLMADWLGPLLGPQLLTLFSTLYLLFSDPFVYTTTAAIWFLVALLGGIIIRKRISAPLTMLGTFSLLLPLMGLSVFGIFQRVTELGLLSSPESILAMLPPPPQGVSLTDLFNSPIIGNVLQQLIEAVQGGTLPQPMQLVSSLLVPLLLNAVKKLGIIVAGAFVGVELGKRVEGFFAPWSESLRERLGGEVYISTGGMVTFLKKGLPALLLGALLLSPIVLEGYYTPAVRADNGDYYSEALVGFVDRNGVAYIGTVFADSQLSIGQIDPEANAYQDALLVLFISQETRWDEIPPLPDLPFELPMEMEDLQSFYNLVPKCFLLTLYDGVDAEIARERADSVAGDFSAAFNTRLIHIQTFSPEFGEESGDDGGYPVTYVQQVEDGSIQDITLSLYGGSTPMSEIVEEFLEILPIEHGGLADLIYDALESNILLPGAGSSSANGTVIVTGFWDMRMVWDLIPEDLGDLGFLHFLLPDIDTKIGFIGLGSYWLRGVKTSSQSHLFDLLRLLGATEPIQFSPDADMSNLLVVTPNATFTEEGVEEGPPIVNLVTTVNLSDPDFASLIEGLGNLTEGVSISSVEAGSTVDTGNYNVTFAALLPLDIQIVKEVSPTGVPLGGEVEVSVSLTNNDESTIENVFLDDSGTIIRYPTSAMLTSGNLTTYWDRIEPGETKTLTYTLKLESSGVYTLMPARVDYEYFKTTFSTTSSAAEVTVRSPSAVGALAQTLGTAWGLASETLGGSGSLILSAAVAAVIIAIAFLEYRKIMKWLHPL